MIFSWRKLLLLTVFVVTGFVLIDLFKVVLSQFIFFDSQEDQINFEQDHPSLVGNINTPLFLQVLDKSVLAEVDPKKLATINQKVIIWWDKRAPSTLTSYYKHQ